MSDPDEVVTHRPRRCPSCEGDLSEAEIVSVERRQVFEVPRTRAHVTEHQLVKLRCSCGCETKAPAPTEATAPACYGPGVRALAVYLSVYQHVPYDRLAEIFADVLSMPVSVGAIKAMVAEAGGGLGLFLDVVTELLKDAPAVHFDETGGRVEGSCTGSTWPRPRSTPFSSCHKRRGTVAMDDMGVIAKMSGVAVHDGWKPYRSYEVIHALCNAHHLRELQGVFERFDQDWAEQMIGLLLDAKEAVEKAVEKGRMRLDDTTAALDPGPLRQARRQGLGRQRQTDTSYRWQVVPEHRRQPARSSRRLPRRRAAFHHRLQLGSSNNQGERDIRMVKLQQKISGSWRTKAGADHFCAIRSYVSTMKKHGYDVLAGLHQLFEGKVWLPGET